MDYYQCLRGWPLIADSGEANMLISYGLNSFMAAYAETRLKLKDKQGDKKLDFIKLWTLVQNEGARPKKPGE